MLRYLTLIAFVSVTTVSLADDVAKSAPAEPAKMKKIFNGKDLTGWDGDPRLWSVRDGVIHGETTEEVPAMGNTFIIWKDGVLKDFELASFVPLQCHATTRGFSIDRSTSPTTMRRTNGSCAVTSTRSGTRTRFPSVSGFIYDEGGLTGKRGRICLVGEKAVWEDDGKKIIRDDLIDQAGFKKLMKVDDWNDVAIIAKGNHIQHYLNGKLILDFTDHPDHVLPKESWPCSCTLENRCGRSSRTFVFARSSKLTVESTRLTPRSRGSILNLPSTESKPLRERLIPQTSIRFYLLLIGASAVVMYIFRAAFVEWCSFGRRSPRC